MVEEKKKTKKKISILWPIAIFVIILAITTAFLGWLGLIASIIYGIGGFFITNQKHKGAIFFLGMRSRAFNSGPGWHLFLIEKRYLVPKKQLMFDYEARKVITKREQEIGAISIGVDATVYFTWPDGDKLLNALELAPSDEPEDLKTYLQPNFIEAIRKTAGRNSWHALKEDQEQFSKQILSAILGENQNQSNLSEINPTPFKTIGFENIDTEITDIILPPELEKTLTEFESARIDKFAATQKAAAERKIIEEKGKGDADARERMLKVVKEAGLDYEALYSFREFAKGSSNTILYQLPGGLSNRISDILGGNSIEHFIEMMPKKQKENFLNLITKTMQKTKGGK